VRLLSLPSRPCPSLRPEADSRPHRSYKILFLDVLFPLELERVIFVDSDQCVASLLAVPSSPPRLTRALAAGSFAPT